MLYEVITHQVIFVLQTTGSIGDQHIDAPCPRGLQGIEDDRGRVGTGMLGDHRDVIV